MMRWAGLASGCLLAAVGPGCSGTAVQTRDASGNGGSGGVSIDAGANGGATGGVTDGPTDAPPFAGRRSFDVTVTAEIDGGTMSHAFTLVLDGDRGTRLRSPAAPVTAHIRRSCGSGPTRFERADSYPLPLTCLGNASYDHLIFTLDAAGALTASGRATLTSLVGEFATQTEVPVSLAGVPDTQPPTLSLSLQGDATDPFTGLSLLSSEPLPADARPTLRSANGDVVQLTRYPEIDVFASQFFKPVRLLRYDERYELDAPGIRDFAGHPAISGGSLGFTTRAAPPLAAMDGFEALTVATFGGAQVLSGAGAPTITGARSLYVPPVVNPGQQPTNTQLALRLPVAAGATAVRFAYRTVNPSWPGFASIGVARVGGMFGDAEGPDTSGVTTPATIGQTQVMLGPMTTATLDLPDGGAGEVIFARIAHGWFCNGVTSGDIPGIIIDDLRVE